MERSATVGTKNRRWSTFLREPIAVLLVMANLVKLAGVLTLQKYLTQEYPTETQQNCMTQSSMELLKLRLFSL
jgi:hypothetical protein